MKKKTPIRKRLEDYTKLLSEISIEEQRARAIKDDDSVTTRKAKAGIKDHLEQLLAEEEKEYEALTQIINALPRVEQRQVVLARYMDRQPWAVITAIIYGQKEDFEEKKDKYIRQIYRIHGYALANANKIINSKE